MSELIPCPSCSRHVRKHEASCPFCNVGLSLTHLPVHQLPRARLSRAATFAFGATLLSASALAGCGGESTQGKKGGGGESAGGTTANAGASAGGTSGSTSAGAENMGGSRAGSGGTGGEPSSGG